MAIMMTLFIVLNTGVTRQIETFIVLVNFCQVGARTSCSQSQISQHAASGSSSSAC